MTLQPRVYICAFVLCIMSLSACAPALAQQRLTTTTFGALPDGSPVQLFTLRNTNGVEAQVTDYGAILVALRVPDKDGKLDDVVLGFDTFDGYLNNKPHFGSVIGRYANRIAKGRFELDGQTYTLATNHGENHLHGGVRGFDAVMWTAEASPSSNQASLRFSYTSPDGEEGYPGTVRTHVTYTLTDANELILDYEATTDKATPINLTHHAYFNLAAHDAGSIADHVLQIPAAQITPVTADVIPTGALLDITDTPLDFRTPTRIGERIDADHPQLVYGGGYDHNYVLSLNAGVLKHAARVWEPTSGRVMDVMTTEPGMQLYTGNSLDGSLVGKGGTAYGRRSAFCLETQHFPDSPNQPTFPSTILRPGDTYRSRTIYAFSVDDA